MSNLSITVDFDDTICFCTDRDFENAKPNTELIQKLNKLYDEGWQIQILTARGQLSCNGDHVAAAEKYSDQITRWLDKHGVKYNSLSFQKKLSTLYVDDKALRPEELVHLPVETFAEGLSGAEVVRVGDRVIKTDPSSYAVARWYKEAANLLLCVPEVYSVVGPALTMEYIPSWSMTPLPWEVEGVLLAMRKAEASNSFSWGHYIRRLGKHADLINDIHVREKIYEALRDARSWSYVMDDQRSFCHGDFTVDNMLLRWDHAICLIDPIPMHDCYSSWVLDASKLIQSCQRKGVSELGAMATRKLLGAGLTEKQVDFLVFGHWLRMRRYAAANGTSELPMVEEKINEYLGKYCS